MDKLSALPLVKMYRDGKRTVEVDGVKFTLKRGGRDNNFLMVSPVEKDRFSPVLNLIYDQRIEDKRTVAKLDRRVGEVGPGRKRFNLRDKRAPKDG